MSSEDEDHLTMATNWLHALNFVKNGTFSADTMLCFTCNGETGLTFHATSLDRAGIVCSKCCKFFKPGSLQFIQRVVIL